MKGLLRAAAIGLLVAGSVKTVEADVTILTMSGRPPFADTDWPQKGMFTELVTAAMTVGPDPEPFHIDWQGDPTSGFRSVTEKTHDLGYPVPRPLCELSRDKGGPCVAFHFSDPVMELVNLVFVRADNDFEFNSDADLEGRSLCRPKGFYIDDLDRPGREWLTRGVVTLVQPEMPMDCFKMLVAGEVDLVSVNEFLGVQQLFDAQLTEMVLPLPRPLSTQSWHVVVSKTHSRATTLLYRFNAGLAKLKQTDAYAEIISRHLTIYWDRLKG
ncbi:transporter substrate-binding domain-containing protein [uncultured Roseobacter sp.]|uniref:substrate-binding periplasmic protein n=1 Tax=uncultured Roseobacter sp. TaxID=114847 RepID=UPI00261DD8EB|nr:transporter substrate-binding domain-containing protein [uncultured Roseobacter sp.]